MNTKSQRQYPNLLLAYQYGWNVDALACGANVSREVMIDVMNGRDDLTLSEKLHLSGYVQIDYRVLFAPKAEFIDTKKPKWILYMRKLDDMYNDIVNVTGDSDKWETKPYKRLKSDFKYHFLITYMQVLRAKQYLEMAHHTYCYKPNIRTKPITRAL